MSLYEGIQVVTTDPNPPVGNLWYNVATYNLKGNLGGGSTGTINQTFFASSTFDSITNATALTPFSTYTLVVPTAIMPTGRVIQMAISGTWIDLIGLNSTLGLVLNNSIVMPITANPSVTGGSNFNGIINLFINATASTGTVTVAQAIIWANGNPLPAITSISAQTTYNVPNWGNTNATLGLSVANNNTGNVMTVQGCIFTIVN